MPSINDFAAARHERRRLAHNQYRRTGRCRRSPAALRGSRCSTTWARPSRTGGRSSARDALATPYQRYEFLSLWQRHVGAEAGFTPFIVVGFDAIGTPLFLLPLGARPFGRWTAVEFLGGKHANFNMGLWRRDLAATIGADALRAVLERACPAAPTS